MENSLLKTFIGLARCVSESTVLPGPGLLLRAMTGSVAFMKPESVLISMLLDTTEGHVNARGLGHHLGPC